MSIDTLAGFVQQLETAGELVRVREPVSLNLEVTEVADRVMKSPGGGPALLFERPLLVNGSPSAFPVAINLFGSMRRVSMAFGVKQLDDIGARIGELLQTKPPEGIVAKLAMLPRLMEVAKFPPRTKSGAAPCHEVVWRGDDVDLDRLQPVRSPGQ